jgi:hypothetical protein
MRGEGPQKRRCNAGEIAARAFFVLFARRRPASRFFHSLRSRAAAFTARCMTPLSSCAPTPAPRIPAQLLAIVGDSGTEDRPLTTPTGVSRLAHPGPPSYLSSPALLSNASISKPPRPLSAVAHSAHAIAPALRVSVAIVRPPAHCLAPLLGVRTAASPAEAPGLLASPPRALATATTHSLSHSVIWPI